MSNKPSMPSFGQYLRALRLGYYWSKDHQLYIRMSALHNSQFLIKVAKDGYLPGSVKPKEFYCWWETKDQGNSLLRMCWPLERIRIGAVKVGNQMEFVVGMDGRLV